MTNQYEKLVNQQVRLKKKMEQEDFKLRQSKYYENAKKRKERTRLLIQKGTLLDKYFEIDNLNTDETEQFLKIFSDYVKNKKPDKFKKDNPGYTPTKVDKQIIKACLLRKEYFLWVEKVQGTAWKRNSSILDW